MAMTYTSATPERRHYTVEPMSIGARAVFVRHIRADVDWAYGTFRDSFGFASPGSAATYVIGAAGLDNTRE
jgi:hypothetical protein